MRDKATRLPGKIFAPIDGRPAIEQLIARLKRATRPDGIVICTSVHPDDAVFEGVAARAGIGCFRGSEEDKLDRYLEAGRLIGAEFAVVVDGDDLLCDPAQIDRIMAAYDASADAGLPADYVIVDDLPLGVTGFGIRMAALAEVCANKTEADTEVWGAYFTESGRFRVRLLAPDEPSLRRPEIRLTLDYAEDLALFRFIFEHFAGRPFGLGDAIKLLDEHPEARDQNLQAQERYLAHLAKAAGPAWTTSTIAV